MTPVVWSMANSTKWHQLSEVWLIVQNDTSCLIVHHTPVIWSMANSTRWHFSANSTPVMTLIAIQLSEVWLIVQNDTSSDLKYG